MLPMTRGGNPDGGCAGRIRVPGRWWVGAEAGHCAHRFTARAAADSDSAIGGERRESGGRALGGGESGGGGGEVCGAEGVLLGVDGEVEVEGEKELELQLVELAQREAADLGPSRVEAGLVLEVLGGCHGGDEEEALEGARGEEELGAAVLYPLDVEEAGDEAAGAGSTVSGDAAKVGGSLECHLTAVKGTSASKKYLGRFFIIFRDKVVEVTML